MLKRELKITYKALIIWAGVLGALFVLMFLLFPTVADGNKEALDAILTAFPKDVLEAFNMDLTGMSSVFAWFQTEGHIFTVLLGSVYAAILGGTILLKEESDKTIEYLYAKPVNRCKIVTAKILCGIINILAFTIIIMIVNLIGLVTANDINYKLFFMLSLIPLIIFYAIFFVSLFISTFFKKTRKMMSLGIGIAFLSYALQIIGNMSDKIKYIKYLSLFELAPARNIIIKESIDLPRLLIGIALITIFMLLTYWRYNKKELV